MSETPAAERAAATGEITAETVQHLAGLARIALTDAEIESLTTELDSILANIAKVSEVARVEPPDPSEQRDAARRDRRRADR
jgi:aspartyl-tRNA(Asn)/glutamyl-tRNA(Gln) amidotransferase subunit C